MSAFSSLVVSHGCAPFKPWTIKAVPDRRNEQLGHEVKKGKPIAAGKQLGKGISSGAQEVGEGVKKAVSTDSDRGDSEKKQ